MSILRNAPDHSTISRTRRLIDVETHREVFTWILERIAEAGLLKGKTIGIDGTTLEANAAMQSIVRRDTGECWSLILVTTGSTLHSVAPAKAGVQCSFNTESGRGSLSR